MSFSAVTFWEFQNLTNVQVVDAALVSLRDRFMTRFDRLLQYLHKRIHSDPDVWNKVFIGMVLFCTYGRSRWSDTESMGNVSSMTWTSRSGTLIYIEVETGVHKTARAMHMKFVFLPLVAPSIGIDNTNWGEAWLSARRELGIESLKDFPLIPCPGCCRSSDSQASQH